MIYVKNIVRKLEAPLFFELQFLFLISCPLKQATSKGQQLPTLQPKEYFTHLKLKFFLYLSDNMDINYSLLQ